MAITLYPADGWNSFTTVLDADATIGGFVQDAGTIAYLALATDEEKEAVLKQAALLIQLCPSIELPDTNESNLALSQCYLTTYSMTTNMLAFDANNRAVTSERVDTLAVTYNDDKKGNPDDFPPIVSALLNSYNCNSGSSSFKMASLGRG